jgi:hypothetical protein
MSSLVGDGNRYLIRDRDSIYGNKSRPRVHPLAMKRSGHRAAESLADCFAERLIGSIRRECLDHVVVLTPRHLLRLLRSYFAYCLSDLSQEPTIYLLPE